MLSLSDSLLQIGVNGGLTDARVVRKARLHRACLATGQDFFDPLARNTVVIDLAADYPGSE